MIAKYSSSRYKMYPTLSCLPPTSRSPEWGQVKRERISSYRSALTWEWDFRICQSHSIFRVAADTLWQGREFTLIKRIPFSREVWGSCAETERPIPGTSTVWNPGLMLHLTLSNTGQFFQCHSCSRARKGIISKTNSTPKSQFLITIANNESSWNLLPIVRTDITVLRPD